jgi:hypothetical protein
MADATPTPGAPSSNRSVMIVVSYLWLLALIPLIVEKNDREVQWHAKHGLVLLVARSFSSCVYRCNLCVGFITSVLAVCSVYSVHHLAVIVVIHISPWSGSNGRRLIIRGSAIRGRFNYRGS